MFKKLLGKKFYRGISTHWGESPLLIRKWKLRKSEFGNYE